MINPQYNGFAPQSALPAATNLIQELGIQSVERWGPGEDEERCIVDARPHPQAYAWRISIVGDVIVRVTWGSGPTRSLVVMDAPMRAVFAGQASVYAQPRITDGETSCECTLAPDWGGPSPDLRQLVTGPLLTIAPTAHRYTALTASVVTIRGTAVAVPVLSSVPLVSGSVLTSGIGYLEHTP